MVSWCTSTPKCLSVIRTLPTGSPIHDSIRIGVIYGLGIWRDSTRSSRNHRLHMVHLYHGLFSCLPWHHQSRAYFSFLQSGRTKSFSLMSTFLPRAASDDMNSVCSTATMCLHLHPLPAVWCAHHSGALTRKRDPVPHALRALRGHVPVVSGQYLDLGPPASRCGARGALYAAPSPCLSGVFGILASPACTAPTQCLRP